MTPAQKDKTMERIVFALIALIAGAGSAAGVSYAKPMTVKIDGPVMAELPPGQEKALEDAAGFAKQSDALMGTFQRFENKYDNDQRETRLIYQAILNSLADHAGRIGKLEVQMQNTTESVREIKQGQSTIEERVQDMERRNSTGANP